LGRDSNVAAGPSAVLGLGLQLLAGTTSHDHNVPPRPLKSSSGHNTDIVFDRIEQM
jgi:hypothetical protein